MSGMMSEKGCHIVSLNDSQVNVIGPDALFMERQS